MFSILNLSDFEEPEVEWQRLARIGQKIQAIKAYRELTGDDLKESKEAAEFWIYQNTKL